MTDGLDAVQDLDRNGHEQSGALQTSIAMDGEENSIAHAEPTSGTLSSINGIDLIGVSCSCLNDLYTTLMSFQSLPSPSFPSSRGSLTKATNLARSVVRCPFCPQDYPSALQNLMLLSTLLPLVAHGYAQLLTHIQERADKGTRVTYRVGDLSQSASHLHTDTWDCPMGFNVELESHEWAAMARKVVKQDVYGNGQSMDCLLSVIEELEQRQHIWHLLQPFGPDTSCPNHRRSGNCEHDALCLQLAGRTRIAIEALNL